MMDVETEKVRSFKLTANQAFDANTVQKIMAENLTISFNGLSYDLPLIQAALEGMDNERIKKISDKIIKSKQPWQAIRDSDLRVPNWNHIDIMHVAPGQASLKLYGGRLSAHTLQDLPFEPDLVLNQEQMTDLETYCVNDLKLTKLLYESLSGQIDLRKKMSEQYGLDLRSKGDAQIAEAVLKHELEAEGVQVVKPSIKPGTTFKYAAPSWITFDDPELMKLLIDSTETTFKIQPQGGVAIPASLGRKVSYDGSQYTVGIGGLHSNETGTTVIPGSDDVLFDVDFASYYPSIILNEKYYPTHLGEHFLSIYKDIVKRRLKAKAEKDMVTADSLKIVINSSFGKFGNKYSSLYSPNLLISVTLTGQLSLLMLIERITRAGGKAISANTDGVVVLCPKSRLQSVRDAMFDFELISGFVLEETHYKSIHIQSVNNYIAVKTDGKVKGKGSLAPGGLMKNPTFPICSEAVRLWASKRKSPQETIDECQDVKKFLAVRTVNGGGSWGGDALGKVVRWYVSNNGIAQPIVYRKSGNKVPKTDMAVPMMTLTDELPSDLDKEYYLNETKKMIRVTGTSWTKRQLNGL